MPYTTRDDEFDGTEYENQVADLEDEVRDLTKKLSDKENELEDVLCLLDDILEDVNHETLAHDRGARTGADAWELLRDIAARIREVV